MIVCECVHDIPVCTQGTGSEQHRHHAVEVAVYNMFCMLWEVEMGTPYAMLKKNDIFSGLGQVDHEKVVHRPPADLNTQTGPAEEEEVPVVEELFDIAEEEEGEGEGDQEEGGQEEAAPAADNNDEADPEGNAKTVQEEEEEFAKELKRAECIVESFSGARVFPLTGTTPADILKKEKFRGMFDAIFVSNRSAQFVNDPLVNTILRDTSNSHRGCLVAMETAKYCVPLLKKQRQDFSVKLREYGISQGWTHCVTSMY